MTFGLIETDDPIILFARIRYQRNQLLLACDWTQISDSTADKEAWATYRQELRDITEQNSDPKKIVFPTQPT
jgi:hypothetical protein